MEHYASSGTYISVSQKLKGSFHEHIESVLLSKNVFEALIKGRKKL